LTALIGLFGVGPILGASTDQDKQQSKSKTVEWGASSKKTKSSSGSKSSFSDKVGKQARQMNEKSKTSTSSTSGKKTSSGSNSSDRKDRETGKKSSSGLRSAAQKNRGAAGGASGSAAAAHKEKPGSSASQKAGREMDRQHYNQKIKESDQKISALQQRIQESKQREKNLNAEYQKTDQAIIVNHAPGAIGEQAGTKSYNTQRSHERGKAALAGPGTALTESRDTWSKNVDAERKTRQGLERDLKNAQSEKEEYQRRLRDQK
jgi:hypothetical protein